MNREILTNKMPVEKTERESIISLEKLQEMALNEKTPRKKILLIDGNIAESKYQDDEYHLRLDNLGLRRIAGYLEKFGVAVNIIRLQDLTKEKQSVLVEDAEIIGISAQSTSVNDAFDFTKNLKQQYPEKMTIGGAEHFALDYEWILKNKEMTGIDACCTGQGELTMLALSLGIPLENVGSLAFVAQKENNEPKIVENSKKNKGNFPRLTEQEGLEILKPVPALSKEGEVNQMPFLELDEYFENAGSTATSTGCYHKCPFCTSEAFYGGIESCLETAKKEIESLYKQGKDFLFVRDAMLNATPKHFENFINFMKSSNETTDKKIGWIAFMSATKNERLRNFKEMSEAGCVEIAVGLEDVIGDRTELKKGENLQVATDFINSAKEHLLVRTLLILGLPEHYNYTRNEIKQTMLDFMKKNPQAIYRVNIWTPIVGTSDFEEYSKMVDEKRDVRKNPSHFKEYDTMHSVIDPIKMYESLDVPKEKRWLTNSKDWLKLRDEIIYEYLTSSEHENFLSTLKNKENLGKKDLQYNVAQDFKKLTLESISK